MSKILKYLLFRTVLAIFAVHTIVPHPHSNELTEERHLELHEKSNSLIGIIRLALHESDDENLDNLIFTQYESVRKIDSKHKYPKASIYDNTTSIVRKTATGKTVKWDTCNFERLFFVKLNRLRGPPVLT